MPSEFKVMVEASRVVTVRAYGIEVDCRVYLDGEVEIIGGRCCCRFREAFSGADCEKMLASWDVLDEIAERANAEVRQ